jgi:hypothetical protein
MLSQIVPLIIGDITGDGRRNFISRTKYFKALILKELARVNIESEVVLTL